MQFWDLGDLTGDPSEGYCIYILMLTISISWTVLHSVPFRIIQQTCPQ